MPTPARPPREGWRMTTVADAELRDAQAGPARLAGHFARFGAPNRIESRAEGVFIESIAPGAFAKTLAEGRSRIRLLFQHGRDPQIGDRPIGTVDELREDGHGPYFEATLFGSVPPLVVDGLRSGAYGVSYRFQVVREDWDDSPRKSPANPDGIPERVIREAKVFEFGPVTFPADAGADIAVRSITDEMAPADPAAAEPEPHGQPARRASGSTASAAQRKEGHVAQYQTLDEMRARERELDEEIKRAAEAPEMDAAAQADFDAMVAERSDVGAKASAWEHRRAQVREASEDPARREAAVMPNVIRSRGEPDIFDLSAIERMAPPQRDQSLRDGAMRAADGMRFPDPRADQAGARDGLHGLIESHGPGLHRHILATSSPQYRRAFDAYVASGGQERGTALAVGVDGTGGFSVPVAFDPTIIATGAHTTVNPYRQACRVVTISGTDTWEALTANAVTSAYANEAAAATEQGPTFTRPSFTVGRAQSYVTVSYEMMQDRPSLSGDLAVLFGESRDTLEESKFSIGSGVAPIPTGMGLKGAFTKYGTITNDTVAVGDILAIEAALPIRHRASGAWFLSRAAIRAIQQWETVNGLLFNGNGYAAVGNPVQSRTGNTGLQLLGYPVWEAPSMPWTPTTDDTVGGVFGDPRSYVIVDRLGMSVRVIPDILDATTGLPTGQHGLYAFWRNTAGVLNADAMRQLIVE